MRRPYSITASAMAGSVGGTVRPSALAVVRLMTRSNLVGCWTGRSAGFAPRELYRHSLRHAGTGWVGLARRTLDHPIRQYPDLRRLSAVARLVARFTQSE